MYHSCMANCKRNAVINLRLELYAVCVGPASKCAQSLTYDWFMYEKDKDGGGKFLSESVRTKEPIYKCLRG